MILTPTNKFTVLLHLENELRMYNIHNNPRYIIASNTLANIISVSKSFNSLRMLLPSNLFQAIAHIESPSSKETPELTQQFIQDFKQKNEEGYACIHELLVEKLLEV